ncbi:methyltransferase domain-containing protein [Pseudanabaena sp. FACHB-2040]|uniref:SAM-dependent methyltransferase n=1 Tax=Pseudanabaena sp. FACHB-2040 TaxID=2692859 RepID=UPI001687001F|nr:methyltransferase domain-containing protein [Pseudanabaena sp. FACHB-2040]MBD2258790.1 methyltransferase domain-containing protein [Pseudanabaena sp. FACHB-2040]
MQPRKRLSLLLAGVSIVGLSVAGCNSGRDFEAETAPSPTQAQLDQTAPAVDPTADPDRGPDVVYVPTPQPVVEEMLRIADVQADDVVYDLGSGDGRIVITAAQQVGARGIGIDIDPQRIREANENAEQAGVTDLVEFRQEDLFQTDFSEATVVTLYLLPELNLQLRPRLLEELQPGTRIVSHAFDMGDWEPDEVVRVGSQTIYYWVVPENAQAKLQ